MSKDKPGRPSQPERADWRGGKPSRAEPDVGFAARRRRPPTRRWLWIPLLVLTLVVLIAALFKFIIDRPQATPLLAWIVTDYRAPLPPNWLADEDRQRFLETWKEAEGWFGVREIQLEELGPNLAANTSSQEIISGVAERVQQADPGGPNGDVVLLYLSLHGVVDAQGRACLLVDPQGQSTTEVDWHVQRDPEHALCYVPLVELLRSCRSALSEQRPKGNRPTRLVVFLDAHKPTAMWPLGMFDNVFAEALSKELAEASDQLPHVVVIGSATRNQVGWHLPESGFSVFGEAVRLALEGEADAAGSVDDDHIVDSRELVRFLRQRVATLAAVRRDAAQIPFVFPSGLEDEEPFPVSFCRRGSARLQLADRAASVPLHEDADYQQFWGSRDRFAAWRENARPIPPDCWLDLITLEQGLRRWEQLSEAGSAYRGRLRPLRTRLTALHDQLLDRVSEQSPDYSLAETRRGRESAEQLRQQVATIWSTPVSDRAELLQQFSGLEYEDRAVAVWNHLLASERLSQGMVQQSLILIGEPADRLEFVELRALRQWREDGHLPAELTDRYDLIRRAMTVRDKAERAVALEDPRTLAFLRPVVSAGDRQRRMADDQLFLGRTRPTDYDAVERYYDAALQLDRDVRVALQTLDRALHELPQFTRLFSRLHAEQQLLITKRAGKIADDLRQNVRGLLNHAQSTTEPNGDDWLNDYLGPFAELESQSADLLRELRELHAGVQDGVQRVLGVTTEDAETLRKSIEFLTTPLVTGEERIKLQRKRWNIARKVHQVPTDQVVDTKDSPGRPFALNDHLLVQTEPFRAIMAEEDSRVKQVGAVAYRYRDRLAEFLARHFPSAASNAEEGPVAASDERFGIAMETRSLAPLIAWPLTTQDNLDQQNPIALRARLARSKQKIFQAQRALDDFYGDDGATPGQRPYFAILADRYLLQVDSPFEPLAASTRMRLQERERSAEQWLEYEFATSRIDGSAGGRATIVVPPGEAEFPLNMHVSTPPQISPGTAAFSLFHQTSRLPLRWARPSADKEAPRIGAPVALPAQPEPPLQWRVGTPSGKLQEATLSGVFFFRNHVQRASLDIKTPTTSQLATWQQPPWRAATLIVEGKEKDPGTASLLLDCSASIQDLEMRSAIAASSRVLTDLSKFHNGLSLWLFGHRIHHENLRWNPKSFTRSASGAQLVSQPKRPDDLQFDLSTDVNLVWRSGDPFGLRSVLDLERIGSGFGQTPLHFAMIKAVQEELRSGPPPRRLIVLTDGRDSSDRFKTRGMKVTSVEDVQAVLDEVPDAQVFILYDKRMSAEDRGAINRLAKALQARQFGIGYAANELDDLVCKLNLALGNFYWSSAPMTATEQVVRSARINDPPQRLPQPGRYRVGIDCLQDNLARVEIRGGEALQLWITQRPGEDPVLEHQPYDEPSASQPSVARVPNPGAVLGDPDTDFNPPGFLLAAHQSESLTTAARRATLRVSLQNENPARFSPRPRWIWAEVTPLRRDAAEWTSLGPPYIIQDLSFEEGRPLPVLRLPVGPWPEPLSDASFARLQLWFSLNDVNPSQEVRLAELLSPDEEDAVPLPAAGRVTYRAKIRALPSSAWEVSVMEQHDTIPLDTASFDGRRVDLTPAPDNMRREWYANIGLIKHVFLFEDTDEETLRTALLRVYRAADIKSEESGTACLPEPLIVPVGPRR